MNANTNKYVTWKEVIDQTQQLLKATKSFVSVFSFNPHYFTNTPLNKHKVQK
jgi:hypothetical protein